MTPFLIRWVKRHLHGQLAARTEPDAGEETPPSDRLRVEAEGDFAPMRIYPRLEDNEAWLKKVLGAPSDLVIRRCQTRAGGDAAERQALICYLEGMADPGAVSESLIRALAFEAAMLGGKNKPGDRKRADRKAAEPPLIVHAGSVIWVNEWAQVLHGVLSGDTVIFLEGQAKAVLCGTRGFETRGIEEPGLESTLKGSREGFVESASVNLTLIRRWVKSPRLRVRRLILGDLTNLRVEVL
ncbi:MAG TPA: spore germination protein, partial [Firmicutes bacterium]|nr:spore germination protein [Bacillota bacterium]